MYTWIAPGWVHIFIPHVCEGGYWTSQVEIILIFLKILISKNMYQAYLTKKCVACNFLLTISISCRFYSMKCTSLVGISCPGIVQAAVLDRPVICSTHFHAFCKYFMRYMACDFQWLSGSMKHLDILQEFFRSVSDWQKFSTENFTALGRSLSSFMQFCKSVSLIGD